MDAIQIGGGRVKVDSSKTTGTRIAIWFPVVAAPHWFTSEIKLTKDDTVVILDDDESIHGVWDIHFKHVIEKFLISDLKHFTQGAEAVKYINSLTLSQKRKVFLLTDYELLEQGINGLDVVDQTGMLRAILVTSYSNSKAVQGKVVAAGIKMLPKEMASAAKIVVNKGIPKWSRKVDMVWVEDQFWVADNLINQHYSNLIVDIYKDPISFLEDVDQYPLDTRIILDMYYESPDKIHYVIDGFRLAKELHNMGYTKLILYTGEKPRNKVPKYLTVVLKNDQIRKKRLDKI